MNIQKVYDSHGKHVDSFRRAQKKRHIQRTNLPRFEIDFTAQVQYLNSRNLFVRGQFSKSGKHLARYGSVPPQTYLKSITAAIKDIF